MTIPELGPQDEQALQRLKDEKAAMPIAPIDESANAFVENLVKMRSRKEPEFVREATAFVAKLVGWSSKDVDAKTGCVPIATFERSNKDHVKLDRLGAGFLTSNPHVNQTRVVSEDHAIDRFDFHQSRKNGSVREVTVYRKEPLKTDKTDQIEYYLRFVDVGQQHPQQDRILAVARMYLENVGREGFALAAQGVEFAAQGAERPLGMVRSLGGLMFGRSGSVETEE